MEPLNTRTLTRAIEFAVEHDNTSIGIIMSTHLDAASLHQQILNEYRNLRGTRNYEIRFSNGSYIRVHSVSGTGAGNIIGRRYNIILISSSVDYDVVFGRMENHEHGHPGRVVYYDASEDRYIEEFIAEDAQLERWARANNLIYDEFAGIDLHTEEFVNMAVDISNYCQTGYTMNSEEFFSAWNLHDEYEFFIENGRLEMKKKEAPDFGEFSPSQELNDFVATLAHGE